MNRVLVVAAFSMLAVLPSRAQSPEIAEIINTPIVPLSLAFDEAISGVFPLQIRFGDMNKSWRRMQISGSDDDWLSQIYSSNPRNPQPQIFYTRGQTVTVNGEALIVTYKIAQVIETLPISDRFGTGALQIPPALTTQTFLELALLNPRLISRFSAVRVLDVKREIAQNAIVVQKARVERTKTINAASLQNLQQIGQQLRSFTQSTGKLPPLQTSAAAQKALQRFSYSSPSPFVHPITKETCATNARLSGKSLKQIAEPSRAIVFHEREASGDGTRGVVFADGSAERILESEFFRLESPAERATFASPKLMPGQKAVKLYGAAALAYIYNARKNREESHGKNLPQFYRSEATGRIYYRDMKNPYIVTFVAPPKNPIVAPLPDAADYQKYAGYNRRKGGESFGGYGF